MLKLRYEEMLTQCKLDYVSYKFFDFHHECHENSNPMSDLVEQRIFPNNCSTAGIFCKSIRLISSTDSSGNSNTRLSS